MLPQMEIARLEGDSSASVSSANGLSEHASNSSSSGVMTAAASGFKRTPGYLPVCRASDPICPIARIPKSEGYVFKTKVRCTLTPIWV
jgi:hypothetical protein